MRYDRSKMHSSIWRTNQIPSLSMVGWIETLNSTIFRHLDRRRTYHWIAGIDTNDVEFVLVPCNNNDGNRVNTGLGRHSIEILAAIYYTNGRERYCKSREGLLEKPSFLSSSSPMRYIPREIYLHQ